MQYTIQTESRYGTCAVADEIISFKADGQYDEAFFSLQFTFENWEEDAYILMPACAYNGNRYERIKRYGYPPMYTLEEIGTENRPLMTDVPALNPDGTGKIEVTAGDMAVPCVGIFYRKAQKGFLLYTEQAVKDKNIGFCVEAGKVVVSYPANRGLAYRWAKPFAESVDSGIRVEKNEEIASQFKIFSFDCESCDMLFRKFFETRKSLMADSRVPNMYTKELWNVMERHFNDHIWNGQYYSLSSGVWAPGWCGGGMSSYPMMKHGSELSVSRAEATLDFMVEHQTKAGFYYNYKNGKNFTDCSGNAMMEFEAREKLKGMHLVRRSGDALNFLCRQFSVKQPKESWVNSARLCADGFVKLYDTYKTFGQYVDIESGKLVVGSSCAGANVIPGLVRAAEYFNEKKYLQTAEQAGEMYYREFVSQGITSGGIGDALCVPDSESIFAFVEGYVLLYEATKEQKWLCYAKAALHIAASWVVTYSYRFPEGSEFHRLGINTVGSVFANAQNKHSAPGICTSSGDYIYRLYQYTEDALYLELLLDVVSFIPQCISTKERPIYAKLMDRPVNAKPDVEVEPILLPEGYINERVNMSDWEGFDGIGNVFNGTCWCETSVILTFTELIYPYGLTW